MVIREDETSVLQDRRFIEEMKADILRRAEAISDEDEDISPDTEKGGQVTVAYEEELDLGGPDRLKVAGDGEESSEGEGDDGEGEGEGNEGRDSDGKVQNQTPETILELAYIRDPRLFERDAQTRRAKSRADLKAQTGPSSQSFIMKKNF